jgi:hypothetical protein
MAAIACAAMAVGDGGGRSGAAPAAAATGPCGFLSGQPATIKHVVVIMDENQSYDAVMGAGSAAPNIKAYANECGVATKYWAITHPSHSNYIGVASGNTYVPPGCTSWTCVTKPLDFCGGTTGTNGTETCPSIFAQLDAAGLSWKVYAESMPSDCSMSAASPYSAGHNPAVWFTEGTGPDNIASSCKTDDVPLESPTVGLQHDITDNSLPAYSWIVPNKCDDMHNCSSGNPVTAGDTFAKTWIDRIIATPDYQNGDTIIFLTWDEGVDGGRPFNEDCLSGSGLTDESCHVPLIAISPYIAAGSTPAALYTHYGLLKATEQLMGITTYLGHAGDAGVGDLLSGFGLQFGSGTTVFADGFESGNLSLWNHVSGAVTVETTNVDTGTYAADASPAGTPAWAWASITPQTDLTYEVDFTINSKTSAAATLMQLRQSGGTPILTVSLSGATNRLRIHDNVSGATATSKTTVSEGAWHHLLVHLVIGAAGTTNVSLDGTDITTLDQTWNTGTNPIGRIAFGDPAKGRTFDVVFDNVDAHT